ncbi:MAG: TlyA family RNA methyltransferase [Oscillospiraceae bacterium]|jgi:23S rRNA (cytidine1920-2'-O)/16S rRNA (cytidine1409-2'-O)-methyltransferase|nr:TlyA family RNA methyltransferase [Oscillospiraceae bacterium]
MMVRLDALAAARGLFPSRQRAKGAILAGRVSVNGVISDKPSELVCEDAILAAPRAAEDYVSRGGKKLERALDVFGVSPRGLVCLDLGASRGGFTQCLLLRGAKRVYAVDVGHGQLAPQLLSDERVVSLEGVNAREIEPEILAEAPQLAVIDVSFISLALIFPALRTVIAPGAQVIALIKPQFEAGRGNVGKKGIVKDPKTHKRVLEELLVSARAAGFEITAVTHSPVRGGDGNIEFLALLGDAGAAEIDCAAVVKTAHTHFKSGGSA